MSSVVNWPPDDIDDVLAADFDGSLSGLGMELGTASFNMSDALMALPNISALKQEKYRENGDSRIHSVESSRSVCSLQAKKTRLAQSADEEVSSAIKRFCVSSDRENGDSYQNSRRRHSSSVPDLRVTGSQPATPVAILSSPMLSQILHISDSSTTLCSTREVSPTLKNSTFQYVLGAATSFATKIDEETMTYLNQGQSYEIKLKKLGDLTELQGKMLKSVIRIGFQERRLQYMEKEQIIQWQQQRPAERILEIDNPLSYGLHKIVNDLNNVHVCEFLWDPTKETGVFVKVNCISTEFTLKKHGGEKGVPFRLQIETYSHNDFSQKLHVASCQIKVFKPKGADRKHKTDKDKMIRRSQSEQEKFKPSYDCTVLIECNLDTLYNISPLTISATTTPSSISTPTSNFSPQGFCSEKRTNILPLDQDPATPGGSTNDTSESSAPSAAGKCSPTNADSNLSKYLKTSVKEEFCVSFSSSSSLQSLKEYQFLSSDASASETAYWLQQQRFGSFVQTFSNFSGSDILRLTREDLIQICGLADGIRLFNMLHNRAIRPRLTMYVCTGTEEVFRAIYLENLLTSDLKVKLASLFALPLSSIQEILISGPSSIRVIVTDDVVQNMSEESMFVIEVLKDQSSDLRWILLKPYTKQ